MARRVSIESADNSDKKGLAQTAKYDKKKMKARMELEGFLDELVTSLYKDDSAPDLDLEDVMALEKAERAAFVRNFFSSAPDKAALDEVVTSLLNRIEEYEKDKR